MLSQWECSGILRGAGEASAGVVNVFAREKKTRMIETYAFPEARTAKLTNVGSRSGAAK
jgi:hypothetical protein